MSGISGRYIFEIHLPRLFGVAALVVLTVAGGVGIATAKDTPQGCGRYRLAYESVIVGVGKRDRYRVGIVQVSDENDKPVQSIAHRDLVIVDQCRDITGDGIPELLVEGHTGGNPGYRVGAIYSMGERVRNLLVLLTRTGLDFSDIKNLDADPALEILIHDISLAGIPGVISARSPSVVMVLCLKAGRYRDCTKGFPDLLEKEIEQVGTQIQSALRDAGHPFTDSVVRALAAEFLALHYLLQKDEDAWGRLGKLAPPEIQDWLKQHRSAIVLEMDSRGSIYYDLFYSAGIEENLSLGERMRVDPFYAADPERGALMIARWESRRQREHEILVEQALRAGLDKSLAKRMREILFENEATDKQSLEAYRKGEIDDGELVGRAQAAKLVADEKLQALLKPAELVALDPIRAKLKVLGQEQEGGIFVRPEHIGFSIKERCGSYTLSQDTLVIGISPSSRFSLQVLRVQDSKGQDRRVLAQRVLHIGWCRDITGDGIPELLIETSDDQDPHCCWTYAIYSLGEKVENLLIFWALDQRLPFEGEGYFRNLDEEPAQEIILEVDTALDRTLGFDGDPGRGPATSPLVLCFLDRLYRDCTTRFENLLDQEIRLAREKLGLEKPFRTPSYDRYWTTRLYTLYVVKYAEEAGWKLLKTIVEPGTLRWLGRHRDEIREVIQRLASDRIEYESQTRK